MLAGDTEEEIAMIAGDSEEETDELYSHPIIDEFIQAVEKRLRAIKDDCDIVAIPFPDIKDCDRTEFLEMVHTIFQVDRIDDTFFVRHDGMLKAGVNRNLVESIQAQLALCGGWLVLSNVICVVNGNEYRPDVGAWQARPSRAQGVRPIANNSPAPDVWIEVVYDNSIDSEHALRVIETVQPHLPNTEFVLIALPDSVDPIPANPDVTGAHAPAPLLAMAPHKSPFLGYLPKGATVADAQWYEAEWNRYITVVGCGVQIRFNLVLECLL